MKDFIYDETKYIKRKDLKDYDGLMSECDFMPQEIEDEDEFNIVFQYLVNLTIKAPDFLPPYENAFSMLDCLEHDVELEELQTDLEQRLIEACERIAEKEDIFKKTVEWAWQENRPLIRGLLRKANNLWKSAQISEANELFSKIYKTNENDNIGARYSVKATAEGMSYEEFEERFTFEDADGSYYNKDLSVWFGEENEMNKKESVKYTVEIITDNSSTEQINFGGDVLTIQPFESNIEGLALFIKNAGNGQSVRIPMGDTKVLVIEDVSQYGHFWFEYTKSDKNYQVDVIIE